MALAQSQMRMVTRSVRYVVMDVKCSPSGEKANTGNPSNQDISSCEFRGFPFQAGRLLAGGDVAEIDFRPRKCHGDGLAILAQGNRVTAAGADETPRLDSGGVMCLSSLPEGELPDADGPGRADGDDPLTVGQEGGEIAGILQPAICPQPG